ncbi:hypothetical protein OH77DRAFT_1175364 [Trametes cingulata]|nr:hypothetical protein OH77DRAFT_1175364 [Trametes cingulata]
MLSRRRCFRRRPLFGHFLERSCSAFARLVDRPHALLCFAALVSCYPAIASHVSRCPRFRGIYGSDSRGTCLFAGSSLSGPPARPVPWTGVVCPVGRLCRSVFNYSYPCYRSCPLLVRDSIPDHTYLGPNRSRQRRNASRYSPKEHRGPDGRRTHSMHRVRPSAILIVADASSAEYP